MRTRRARSSLAGLALAALLLAASAWWFASPWWTLHRMREAAEARDAKALSAYIDYGALRRSTGRQLDREIGPLGRLVARAAVRPETVRLLFLTGAGPARGERPPARRWSVTRQGLNNFRAAPEDGKTALTFRRDGLSWKLEEVAIGKDQASKN